MRRIAYWVLPLALLGIPHYSHCETLSQLITDSRVLGLDAASSTRQRFTDAQITEFLNMAQRDAMSQTRPLQASISFQLSPGVTYYSLPTDYLSMTRLTVGQQYIQEASPAALDGRARGWQMASGYPVYYFINWSSPTLVGFSPWPAQATDTDTVRMDYFQNAADLVNSSDQPFNSVPKLTNFHHGLAYYAAAMMLINTTNQTMVQTYLSEYQATVAALKTRAMERPNYLPSTSGAQ